MRIPTREEFSPLPEVVDRFGLPDPTAILPELENQLEAVAESQAQVENVAAGLRGIADDLDNEAATVSWEGAAGDQFRTKNAEITQALRGAADNISAAQADVAGIDQDTKDLIGKIILTIGALATLVGGIIGVIIATTVGGAAVAITAIIAGLCALIYALLDEVIWLVQKTWEGVQWLAGKIYEGIEAAGEWIGELIPGEPSGIPNPRPQVRPTPPPTV